MMCTDIDSQVETGDAKREFIWNFIPSPYESNLPTLHVYMLRATGSMVRYRKPAMVRDRNATRATYDFSDEILLVTYRSGGKVNIKWRTVFSKYESDVSDSSEIKKRSIKECEITINPIAIGKTNKIIIESTSRWTILVSFDVFKDPTIAHISEQWVITPYVQKMRFQSHTHSAECAENCTSGAWILDGHSSNMSVIEGL